MLRQLQRLLVRPALAVYATQTAIPAATKSLIFDAALKCLGLMAIHAEVGLPQTRTVTFKLDLLNN